MIRAKHEVSPGSGSRSGLTQDLSAKQCNIYIPRVIDVDIS